MANLKPDHDGQLVNYWADSCEYILGNKGEMDVQEIAKVALFHLDEWCAVYPPYGWNGLGCGS